MIEALALVGVISLLIVARKSLRWYRMNRAPTPWFWWRQQ